MSEAELLIAGRLVAVAGPLLARRLSVPYPIVLVVGGALLGFFPGLPEVRLDPEVVLVVFLPALIRRLRVSDIGADADEEVRTRLVATKAALEELDALAGEEWTRDEAVERMRALYEYR